MGRKRLSKYFEKPTTDPQLAINPGYITVERVIAMTTREPEKPELASETLYLVKWRGLPHIACTWEYAEVIKNDRALEAFKRVNTEPPQSVEKWTRPSPETFEKMKSGDECVPGNSRSLAFHQVEGVNWLVESWYTGKNVILADEVCLLICRINSA